MPPLREGPIVVDSPPVAVTDAGWGHFVLWLFDILRHFEFQQLLRRWINPGDAIPQRDVAVVVAQGRAPVDAPSHRVGVSNSTTSGLKAVSSHFVSVLPS